MSSAPDSSPPRRDGRGNAIRFPRSAVRALAIAHGAVALNLILTAGCSEQPNRVGQGSAREPISASTPGTQRVVSNAGTYEVFYVTEPSSIPMNEPFEIRACVTTPSADASPPSGLSLFVDAAMPEHQHGMNTKPSIQKADNGCYQIEGMLFHMPGRWELYFDITRDGITERAQTEINLD